jgi:DNA-binding transcriptional LysR family regulator
MMHDIETGLLRTFVTIAECGGVTAAARRLGKTQAAVSMQLRRLEEDVGSILLERASRGMALTEAGHILMPYAQKILGTSMSARQALAGKAVSGIVRLGMIEDIAVGSLPNALQRFAIAHPNVALEIVIAESAVLSEKLAADALDIVIADPEHMQATPQIAWQQPLRWTASRNFTLTEGEALPLITFNGPCTWQQRVAKVLGQAAKPWRTVCTSTSLSAVQSAIEAGLGVAVLLDANIRSSTMKIIGTAEGLPPAPDVDFGLFIRSGNAIASPAAEALSRFISDELPIANASPPVLAYG